MYPQIELIWASPRELLNIFQADAVGCHIITVTHDLLKKLAAGRQGSRRVLARYRQDVPQRRGQGGFPALKCTDPYPAGCLDEEACQPSTMIERSVAIGAAILVAAVALA